MRRGSAEAINKMLNSYHFFSNVQEAKEFIAKHRWRKFVMSSNKDGTCWTVYHKER